MPQRSRVWILICLMPQPLVFNYSLMYPPMVHVLPWKWSGEKEESPCSTKGCVKHQDCQKENVLRWSLSAQCSATTCLECWFLVGYSSSESLTFSLTRRKGCAKSLSSPCMSDWCVVLPGLFCRVSPLAISSVLGATFPRLETVRVLSSLNSCLSLKHWFAVSTVPLGLRSGPSLILFTQDQPNTTIAASKILVALEDSL